ncbi:DUF1983 domain-containing protein [Cronobacter sakazakii]|nr:DUF1983 domain-containing protein [Cronobacter sakazakii]EJO9494750.1 DUF1983 domain-containing protein [Cronobacter sakazakii]EJP5820152.1 DUF1983 domain-containing protein [Cronobacter sakazakii]EJQ8004821.1 DUF1983 domain-containing protein [Cronobacter sakazakii]EJQ8906226.1 DUF1983 domain-containing protein [Cronobacter sakazakii]
MDQFKKKKLPLLIAGAGGKKKGGGSSRTPVEANDTVNSRAMASILDLLGEGVIGGLVDGAKSIFIDNLPIINEDGSSNFSGITWEFRDGSQDQTPMAGFDFVETPKSVNIQLKRTHPVTVAIDNDDADRVRVIMKFPSLRSISKKTGDTNGTTVQYRFQIANGDDTFRDAIPEGEKSAEITLTAKKSGVYYRSYELKLPKPGRSYKIRVTRLTDDSTSSYLFNDTWVDSLGEIVDTPMNYPNSVLCGLKVNSEQFGSTMPARSYLVRGLKIRVPANYNETSNTYVGVWDGTFKLLSSSNPAWILFDLLTNTRYGLGQFVSESMIDLGQLYQIGRYCDEEVNDGFGGKEKRFAINTQITSRQDAYRLIQDIAGAFRGMVFWAGGMVNIMQDSPSDPVMMFTNANVKDGMFTYKGSARKDRPSVALITEAMTKDVLSFLTGKITSSELGQELLEEIDTKASQEAVDAINKQMEESLKELDQSVSDLDGKLSETSDRLEQAQNDLKTEVSGTLDKVNEALSQVEDSNAALVELQETVSEQGKAVAGAVEAAQAALDNSSALIAEEREARVEGDKANAKQIEAMKSSVDDSVAAVEEMKKTVAEVERASAEVTTNIEALVKTNIDLALRQDEDQHKQMVINAKIAATQKTFADDMSAMASKVEEIRAEIGEDIRASITEETTARVEADKAITTQITKLEAQINDDISAAIVSEQEARATADESLSRQITSLQAKVEGDISAALTEEQTARASGDGALSEQITSLKAQTGEDIKAAVASETKARTDADSGLATQISTLKAQTAQDIKAAVATETKARTDADSALAGQITSLKAQTAQDINAAITSEANARANADGALGSRIDTLKASVDGNSATIRQQATAIADTNKKVSTAWTLKMETSTSGEQKYVAGIALGIDSTGLSQFLVQADRFGLVNSVNGKVTTPFVVENSIAYMNGAYIKDGTITNAKVGDLQSTNFVSGRSGWRFEKNGVLEINGSSGGQGRLVITGQRIDVYDDNNVLRVRLGQL